MRHEGFRAGDGAIGSCTGPRDSKSVVSASGLERFLTPPSLSTIAAATDGFGIANPEVSGGALPKPSLPITPEVERELRKFTNSDRRFITASLRARTKYYEEIRGIFRREGVPEELVNVAVIESQFQPNALSPRGALGVWQFVKYTAQL
jgi:membrane-bound lytic murein transglycosylase D